jgi:hypothetical protein
MARKSIAEYQPIYDFCQNLSDQEVRQKILALVVPRLLALPALSNNDEHLFTGEINLVDQSISYNLRRCGRLCQTHSTALLAKFAAFIARVAFEHDFGGGKD